MPSDTENDLEGWFRPSWELEDEDQPPGPPLLRKAPPAPEYDHPLLNPLARAENALARLEARAEAASETVNEGLRTRLSYLEAAGWLRHAYVAIHPLDLALREHGGVSSYGTAARSDRLAAVLPATMAQHGDVGEIPSSVVLGLDVAANRALDLARLWRRLAELRTWRPLASVAEVINTLTSLKYMIREQDVLEDWLGGVDARQQGPVLIRVGRAAMDWLGLPGVGDRDPRGYFLAACLWQQMNSRAPIPLPFWAAPEVRHHRLGLKIGIPWMAEYLECVAAAATIGLRELAHMQEIERKGRSLGATKRSRLPAAVNAVLKAHIVTAATLARSIGVTPRAALDLLGELVKTGIVREATRQASWRAYVLASS
jgi:HTH DNA binding domain